MSIEGKTKTYDNPMELINDWFDSKPLREQKRLMALSPAEFHRFYLAEVGSTWFTKAREIKTIDPLVLRNRIYLQLNNKLLRSRVWDDISDVLNKQDIITIDQALKRLESKETYHIDLDRIEMNKYAGLKKLNNICARTDFLGYTTDHNSPEIERWMDHNIQAVNFLGQTVIDKKTDNGLAVYIVTHGRELKKQFIYKDHQNDDIEDRGHYLFYLIFPNCDKNCSKECSNIKPFNHVVKLDNSPKTQELYLKRYSPKHHEELCSNLMPSYFWNIGDLLHNIFLNFDKKRENRYDLTTMSNRFKFVRTNLCGISQNFLAKKMEEIYEVTHDQKKIDYWESSDKAVPPFMKNNNLQQACQIFADNCEALMSYELKEDNEFPENKEIKYWLMDFITYGINKNSNLKMPEFILKSGFDTSEVTSYEDYQDWADLGKMIDKQYSDIPEEWIENNKAFDSNFLTKLVIQIFSVTRSQTVLNELKLVYPKDQKTQKHIFDLFRHVRQVIVSESAFINRSQDWDAPVGDTKLTF